VQLWKKQSISPLAEGYTSDRSLLTDDFSWPRSFSFFLKRIIDARSIILASHSLDQWLYFLIERRHAQWCRWCRRLFVSVRLFMRDLSLLQRPNAASVKLPVKHVGNLVTASFCRTSRPSRLTGVRIWRWVHFSLKAFPIPLDLSILRLFCSLLNAHATHCHKAWDGFISLLLHVCSP